MSLSMNMGALLPWGGLLFGASGFGIALLTAITGKEGRRAEAAAKNAESAKDRAEATAKEHETWFEEADAAYRRIDRECQDCRKKLRNLDGRFHRLIDGLDDLCQGSEDGLVDIIALRTVVRAARYDGTAT